MQQAVAEDQNGQYENAVVSYTQAVESFLEASRLERTEATLAILRQKIAEYIGRIQVLKAALEKMPSTSSPVNGEEGLRASREPESKAGDEDVAVSGVPTALPRGSGQPWQLLAHTEQQEASRAHFLFEQALVQDEAGRHKAALPLYVRATLSLAAPPRFR